MVNKTIFYTRHGVEEFYLFDPDTGELNVFLRSGWTLDAIEDMNGWVSPRLGIRFDASGGKLQLFRLDGRPFLSFVEISRQLEAERQRVEQERQRADVAEAAASEMSQRMEAERQAVEAERERVRRLEEQLRALGIEPAS